MKLVAALKRYAAMDRRSDEARRDNAAKRIARFEAAAEHLLDFNRSNIVIAQRKLAYRQGRDGMCAMFDEFERRRKEALERDGSGYALDPQPFGNEHMQDKLTNGQTLHQTYHETVRAFALLESPMMSEEELEAKINEAAVSGSTSPLNTAMGWVDTKLLYYQRQFYDMAYRGAQQALRQAEGRKRIAGVGDAIRASNSIWAIRSFGVPRRFSSLDREEEERRWASDVERLRDEHLKATVARKWEHKVATAGLDDENSPDVWLAPLAKYRRLQKSQPRAPSGTPGNLQAGLLKERKKRELKETREAAAKDLAQRLEAEREQEWQDANDAWERASQRRLALVKNVKVLVMGGSFYEADIEKVVEKQAGMQDEYAWTPVETQRSRSARPRHSDRARRQLEYYESDVRCATRLQLKRDEYDRFAKSVEQAAVQAVREQCTRLEEEQWSWRLGFWPRNRLTRLSLTWLRAVRRRPCPTRRRWRARR